MNLLSFDISSVLNVTCLLFICLGTLLGLLIGALPGLGPTVGVALLLPISYTMDPLVAISMLVALYQAAEYGGSISSIVLGMPGTAAAVPTLLDGYPMAKGGKPGKALAYSLTASTIGGLFGVIVLMTLTVPLAQYCYKLSDPELFLVALFGLLSVSGLSSTNLSKTMVSILLGLFLGTIGLDTFTGVPRFSNGIPVLYDGFDMVSILIGMFALAEVFKMVMGNLGSREIPDVQNLKTKLTWKEIKEVLPTTIKSSVIGVIFGIIPGLGGGVAAWISYTEAKRSSKHPETFGKGDPNGIAAAESANNAVVGGALIPFLTLGIPGSATIAVVSSAFIMQGIQPGPSVMKNHADLVYGLFVALLIATVAMYIFGRLTTSLWARVLVIPDYILAPVVLILGLIGAYSSRGMVFDVWVALAVGIIWFFLGKVGFSKAAFILAYILAYMFESSFRRSLSISHGSYSIFVNRPFCVVILVLILVTFVGRQVVGVVRARKNGGEAKQ